MVMAAHRVLAINELNIIICIDPHVNIFYQWTNQCSNNNDKIANPVTKMWSAMEKRNSISKNSLDIFFCMTY